MFKRSNLTSECTATMAHLFFCRDADVMEAGFISGGFGAAFISRYFDYQNAAQKQQDIKDNNLVHVLNGTFSPVKKGAHIKEAVISKMLVRTH
jgi:hypothetical protein